MHVAIDLRATGAHFPGVTRATLGLLEGLRQLPDPFEIDLIATINNPSPAERTAVLGDERFRWHTAPVGPFAVRQHWQLPRLAHRLGPDCWHAPFYLRPFFGMPPTIVTIFDVIGQRVPEALRTAQARVLFAAMVRLSVRTARTVITSSAATARDLQALHDVPSDKLAVVPLATDSRFRPQSAATVNAVRERYNLPARYVLYLGSNKPHKQPAVAVEAFGKLLHADASLRDVALVLAGRWDQRYDAAERVAATVRGNVLFRPDVEDDDLPALLTGAEVFVFPSRYEGFGLPPLEAMACGTPVIVSNRTSLPEVVGDAGLLVEPTAMAFADALRRVLNDTALQATLRERGLRRAVQFSWQRSARETLRLYGKLLARVGG